MFFVNLKDFNTTLIYGLFLYRGCDVVLGIPWLKELGFISWNFKEFLMQFFVQNQSFTLKGLQPRVVNFLRQIKP